MNKDMIKEAYDTMTPDEAARQRMLKRILNQGGHKMNKEYSAQPQKSRGWLGAAAAILVLVVMAAGVATMLSRGVQNQLNGDQTESSTESISEKNAIEDFTQSSFYRATMEWYDYLQTTGEESGGDSYYPYRSYGADNTNKAAKLDQILANYGLKMYDGDDVGTDSYDHFLESVSLASFLRQNVTGVIWDVESCWWYDQQRFNVAGTVTMDWEGSPRTTPVDFNFFRTSPEYMLWSLVEMGHLEDYEYWAKELPDGKILLLAAGEETSYVISYSTADVVVILVDNWKRSEDERTMSREALDAFAELFHYFMVERIVLESTDIEIETTPEISAYPCFDIDDLANCTAAVSLQPGDFWQDDTGMVFTNVTIYTYNRYDMTDIAELEVGEYIDIGWQTVEITSLDRAENGDVLINGGLEAGGYTLRSNGESFYYEVGAGGAMCWQEYATTTIPVSPDCQFRNVTQKCTVVHTVSEFLESCANCTFSPDNTTIVIQNGAMLSMDHVCSHEETVHYDEEHHDEQHHGH